MGHLISNRVLREVFLVPVKLLVAVDVEVAEYE